ncbi:MAG: hypothetical protein JNL39_17910 [Opitutaceae bacterium]|nr:hypothetical protein [Opitutaceae bacterium]
MSLRRLAALAWLAAAGAASAAPVAIRWHADREPVAVEVEGLPAAALRAGAEQGADIFPVFAEQAHASGVPPMLGTWSVAEGRLRFEPRFPLVRGVRYRAEYRGAGAPPVVSRFELPADTAAPTTTVVQVFPSAAVLPENQLKFYVHFSAPMSRGDIFTHVSLRGENGKPIELPFLELAEELWDPRMTRLTLLIDPGRIKRGVKPLMDLGPALEAGKAFTLVIAADCRDAAGRPLRAAFEKKFRVGAADRTPVDPKTWTITAPKAGTREPLQIDFGEPLDHALALRTINVAAGQASLVGETTLGAEERTWRFVPDQPWRAGSHRLVVGTTIEDLAGNNVGKAFDVDVFERVERRIETPTVEVAFAVK